MLHVVISDRHFEAAERPPSDGKAREVPTEASSNADRPLTRGAKPEGALEHSARSRSQRRWIQCAGSNVEKSHTSELQINYDRRALLLSEGHALQSNAIENDSTKEGDHLSKHERDTEPNRDNLPLLFHTSLVLHAPQDSAKDTESLQTSRLIPPEEVAVDDDAYSRQEKVLTVAVSDDLCKNPSNSSAGSVIKRKGSSSPVPPENSRQAYVEDANEDTVVPLGEQDRARMSGGLFQSNNPENVDDVTPSEHIAKAKSHPVSTQKSHRNDRGDSLHWSESKTLETLDEQEGPFENIEMDELGMPIFMWPDGPKLNDILDECHEQLQGSKLQDFGMPIDTTLYFAIAEQDESDVTNTAELLKKGADLGPEHKIDVSSLQQKETIFVLATKLLQAFTPQGHSSIVTNKYWGAVDSILVTAVRH